MHKRKITALAVAGALGAPAAAFAQSNVEIYGRLYPEFTVMNSRDATSATATVANGRLSNLSGPSTGLNLKRRNSVDASNSRIGFRGKEDVGGGSKAIWQMEQKATIDDANSGTLANRDSFVGLDMSGFGTVRLGNITTVYKDNREPIRAFGVESGNFVSANGLISSTPWGNKNAFHLRQANSFRYDSPVYRGVRFAWQYAPDEIRKPSPGAASLNATLWSMGVRYQSGPLYLTLSHEVHNDFFGGSAGGLPAAVANDTTGAGDNHAKDTATRAVAAYTAGPTRVAFSYSPIKYSESGTRAAGNFDNYKHKTAELAWEQAWFGLFKTLVFYASNTVGTCSLVGAACSTSGLEGKMLVLGAEYAFSKRSALFAFYAKLVNASSAIYNNAANVKTVDPGSDITHFALGVKQDF